MHYAVPRILHEAGMLERLCTDICSAKGWPSLLHALPQRWLPKAAQRLAARVPEGIPSSRIVAFNSFGYQYARSLSKCRSSAETTNIALVFSRKFCELVLKCGFRETQGVYTFNSAGLEILQRARREGLRAVVEQTIAPKRLEGELLSQERERFPKWESAQAENEFATQYAEREAAEWQAADLVLCGSGFVRDGIARCGGPVEKCVVVPYGVDVSKQKAESRKQKTGGPLRVLTVGAVGLRKGAPYVLEAAKQLKGVAEFRWVGGSNLNPAAIRELDHAIDLTGPVPRSEVNQHFQWADVFLLPSICEGSATVTYEALAHGLPVVCTPNAGSVVRDPIEGFLVAMRDAKAIAAAIGRLAGSPDLRARMGQNARLRATEFTVEAYGQRLLSALKAVRSRSILC